MSPYTAKNKIADGVIRRLIAVHLIERESTIYHLIGRGELCTSPNCVCFGEAP